MSREPGTYIELDDAWDDPGWTRVPNTIARCNTISRRVKGWALEVASHARGRRLTFAEMLKFSTDGRDATYSTIKEAVGAGLVTRHQERDANGRVGAVVYRVHVTPQNPRSEPLTGLPDTAQPVTAKPETIKQKTKNLEDQDHKHDDDSSPLAVREQNMIAVAIPPRERGRVDATEPDPQNASDERAPRFRDLKPDEQIMYGQGMKLFRLIDFIDASMPGGLSVNELNAVQAMLDRDRNWREIFRAICNQRDYDRAHTKSLLDRAAGKTAA